jgi:Fe-S-cluster containining protein
MKDRLDEFLDKIPDKITRRKLIIEEMAQLELSKIHCYNCDGHCCTKLSNSMKITPVETYELLQFLVKKFDIEDLKLKLLENIKEFRLDHEVYTGKKASSSFRKTYTCPFYTPGSKGCSIEINSKPYGCLAFNPKLLNDNGSQCGLNANIFKEREQNFENEEALANKFLINALKLDWEKLEIPRALISFIINLDL